MFTGIISHTGIVKKNNASGLTVSAERSFVKKLTTGASVSVQGICLTVTGRRGGAFDADIMPETKKRTTAGALQPGTLVNLELPATPNTFLSGHVVQGHIDGIARLTRITTEGNSRLLTFAVPAPLSKYIVAKGSVAVNGVSLTVIASGARSFSVGIIPHTWKETMLHLLTEGDEVNIETDVMAKYLEQFTKK